MISKEQALEWAKEAKFIHKWEAGHKVYGSALSFDKRPDELEEMFQTFATLAYNAAIEDAAKILEDRPCSCYEVVTELKK